MGAGEVHVLYSIFSISICSFNVLFVLFISLLYFLFLVSICSLISFFAQVKFMGQEENTELREKLEELEEDITDQQAGDLEKILKRS